MTSSPGRDSNLPHHPSSSPRHSTSVPRSESIARLASPVVPGNNNSPTPTYRVQTPNSNEAATPRSGAGSLTPLAGVGDVAIPSVGPGVSALAAALSHSFGTSPPRQGTPTAPRSSTPPVSSSPATGLATTGSGGGGGVPLAQILGTIPSYGSFDGRTRTGYENPEIVRRHLVQPGDTDWGSSNGNNNNHNSASESSSVRGSSTAKGKQPINGGGNGGGLVETGIDDDGEFSSLRLQGGDVTRGIYKWSEEAEARQKAPRRKSFTTMRPEPEAEVLNISSIKVPGGFRRNYIRRAAGASSPSYDGGLVRGGGGGGGEGGEANGWPGGGDHQHSRRLATSSFLEFLTLYGHFAGEELEEDDEVLGPDEYFASSGQSDADSSDWSSGEEREPMEDSTLLTPSRRRRRRKARGGSGTNSPTGAALLLLKSFVGTGVLFLPRAYLNGGMLFSNLVLLFVAGLSYHCFVLLVDTRMRVEGSFGDIGGILYGGWLRKLILTSIVLSQMGFVAAYIVFTSENLRAFILAVTACETYVDMEWLILMQMVVFLPFSLLRDIGKLGFTALVADAFILVGLAYLLYYDVLTLAGSGLADIIIFNPRDWTLFIGTAIFTFEGVGLIIPIQESMRRPEKFPGVLAAVMVVITVLFVTMGAVSYAAYGSATETVVLLNLPQDDRLVNGVQLLYSAAILLSTPLQIFPAIRITENALFTRSGKYNPYIKWQKNGFRFLVVMLCAAIAWGGANSLDKFVALVGNFACIPLVYIYPPLLHYRGVARNRLWKLSDAVLCGFGFIAMAYTTSLTLMSWANQPSGLPIPAFCDKH